MKAKEKITGVLLAACVLMALMPAAFATDDVSYISTLTELEAFRDKVNGGDSYAGKTVVLTADIDMSGSYGDGKASWTPIGNESNRFNGTFDGGGHAVSGLYINAAGSDYQGLFGSLDGGVIKNLSVEGSVIGKAAVGGVCGMNRGIITNCYHEGTVSSGNDNYVGGICGYNNSSGSITYCYSTGSVSGNSSVGGVCGLNAGTVENCYYFDASGAAGDGTSLTESDFASGRAAWLLQNGQDTPVWGQNLETDRYPVLGGAAVYQVTFQEDGKDDAVRYCNAGGLSTLPEITAQDGYTAQWQTSDGTEFTAQTAVSGDIVLTAAWIADAAPTPEPTPTATPEPTPTATPEPTPTATPEPTPTGTPEPTPTGTPEPASTVTPEPASTVTPEPASTATPVPEPVAPGTGDGSAPGLWLAVLALAGAGLTGLALRERRRKEP